MGPDSSSRFDRAAATWDDNPQRIDRSRDVARAIREALPLSAEMAALEIGCGTGLVTMALAEDLGRIVALDTSEEMLKALQAKMDGMGVTNVTPMRLDLVGDPLPDLEVDLVFSSMALHHVSDPAAMVQRAARLLRPGGFMALIDLDAEDGSFHGGDGEGIHHGFSAPQMAELLAAAGLRPLGSRVVHTIERPGVDGGVRAYTVLMSLAKRA